MSLHDLIAQYEKLAADARMFNDDAAKARARAFEQAAQMLRAVIDGGAA